MKEQVIGVVNSSESGRVLLVLRDRHAKPFELRTESFAADVGWYTQQTLELTRDELNGLKGVLGLQLSRGCSKTVQEIRPAGCELGMPAILSFSAASKRA